MSPDTPFPDLESHVRHLKGSSTDSASAYRWVRFQIPDHLEPASELEPRWAQLASTYEDIVDDSRATATRLSTTITMFTSLQNSFKEASPTDVVNELATLRKAVAKIDTNFAPRLDSLRNAIQKFLSSPEVARISQRPGSERSPDRSHSTWVGSASSALQAVGYHLLWTPLVYVGGLVASKSPPPGAHSGMEVKDRDRAFVDDATSPEQVVSGIRRLLRELESQNPGFGVFHDIKNALISEFDRYTTTLETAKDQLADTPDAIRRAHADIASRAGQWKELARVLVEYARL